MKASLQLQAIIFDFDGVILDSVSIKTAAFRELYAPFGKEIQDKVVAYHEEHGGISRYKKFPFWHKEYLGISLSAIEIEQLAEQFSNLVFQKVLKAPFIQDVDIFLDKYSESIPFFICTGTPQEEINKIIKQRKLGKYFREVHGSPKTKEKIVMDILQRHAFEAKEVLFIGDAMTDYKAAKATNLEFLGIVKKEEKSPFPVGTAIIENFKSLMKLSNMPLKTIISKI